MWEDFTTSVGRSSSLVKRPVTMRIGSATLRREPTMTNCEVSIEYDSSQAPAPAISASRSKTPWPIRVESISPHPQPTRGLQAG